MVRRILSLVLVSCFLLQQAGFAQGLIELNIAGHLSQLGSGLSVEKFRPLHLRFFSYDALNDSFKVLLDKGDLKNLQAQETENQTKELLKYFLIGVTLPNDTFWVNLRPDSENQIIDSLLEETDIGKIMLEADLQLKKDTAMFTSPQTPEGKVYWDKLYKKAEELYGNANITIPTLTRPWIVPNEVIVRETKGSAYIYKATLKVLLEQDYLKDSATYSFKDGRSRMLNEYSSQLIRELIIPKLTQEVNLSKRYAPLRQVFYSLILSRWFKSRFQGQPGTYSGLINKQDLSNLTSKEQWSKTTYFKEYQKSFSEGEYNIKEPVYTPTGQVIRSYFSGGVKMMAGSAITTNNGFKVPGGRDLFGMLPGVVNFQSPAAVPDEVNLSIPQNSASPVQGGANRIIKVMSQSSPIQQIRTDFTVPEGQKPNFFTIVRQEYRIAELFAKPVDIIPDAVVNAVKAKLDQDIAEGKILSAMVNDFGATEIDIHVTHRYGELNAAVERLIMEAMKAGCLKAQELGLLRKDIDISAMDLRMLAKSLRMKHRTHSIHERDSEPVVIGKIIGAGIGAANIKLFHQFFMPGSTPQRKLGYLPKVSEPKKAGVRGFRAIVRKTEDVLKGNYEGKVWEFENCAEGWVGDKYYPSVDQREELLAVASQPNDYLITAVYPVEGSKLPSTEPLVSVVYQAVYGEDGSLRTLDPTFIFRSQSGADAVGGIARIIYDVNFVPGGPNGKNYVVTRPATLEEARKAPKEGTAHAVVYGHQSEGNGMIPWETGEVVDHVAINPPAVDYQRKLADQLAKVMTTHKKDQPYLTPFAAEAQVAPLREAQSHLFQRAPKETEVDPLMENLEARVARGELLAVGDDKADMGGSFGHNFTPSYMLGIDRASIIEAIENGTLSDGNIIGYLDKGQLAKGIIMSVGDDSHMLMLGDRSPNGTTSHQLSFTAFTRGYLASMVGNRKEFDPAAKFDKSLSKKPYGRGQDFTGKEAKAAIEHPYFYSHFSERFFEILKEVMPADYRQMAENLEKGWRHWKATRSEGITLEKPFSGNVSQQGIGIARYLVDIAGGERGFGILAGDKMGPAALNRILREAGDMALAAGEFKNGLVYEIQDAKAYDERGNIPIEELPELFADIEDSVTALKKASDQDFVKSCYKDGWLKSDLSEAKKESLAKLLKESGYVPNKRIFLDAKQDKKALDIYLADSDRFNVKQIWDKIKPGWDINKPQDYLGKPMLGSSITKLGILAGGEYIGKDDPVMIGNMKLMKHVFEFLRTQPLIIQGDMNGSHWLAAIPTAFKYLVANAESHPILGGWVYTLSEDGKTVAGIKDVFDSRDYKGIRSRMFEFNHKFQKAQLGGQFEPYGTNRRTVEASYPLAKFLDAIEAEDSPFLVKNKPVESRATRPIGTLGTRVELFDRATRIAASPMASSGVEETSASSAVKLDAASGEKAAKILDELYFSLYEYNSMKPYGPNLNDLLLGTLKIKDHTFSNFAKRVTVEDVKSIISTINDIRLDMEKNLKKFNEDAAYLRLGQLYNELGGITETTASSPTMVPPGGIDFRPAAMNIKYETMGSFAGLDFSLPKLSPSDIANFDLDKEAAQIETMINTGILPSGQRIKEFMAASALKGEFEERRETVLVWLAQMGILEESNCCTQESSKEYREALVIADSMAI